MAKEIKQLTGKRRFAANDRTIPCADFTVDKAPVFKEPVPTPSFEQLLNDALQAGKNIKPIRYCPDHSFEGVCPFCGALNAYIYDNNGRGQYKCTVCRSTFTVKTTISDEVGIYCPYCGQKLVKHHDRKGYIVYICNSKKYSYY